MNNKRDFLRGAVILSVAGGISKIMGGIYRIPLARMIGDEGMALYQMAYPVYTAILALATAGIPVAISVLVSQKETQGYTGDSHRIFRTSLLILAVFGLMLTLMVMKAASFIAVNILDEPRVYYAILAVAPAIFLSGLISVFRGYFQGYQTMLPTGISQVIEQLFRVIAVLLLAFYFFPKGLEYAVAEATFGAVVGGIVALIVLSVYFISFRKVRRSAVALVHSGYNSIELAKEVVRMAVPVSLGACVLPLVQILDAVIVRKRLEAIGYSHLQATTLFGQLSGKAAVLIGLPTIFTIAVATSMVPAVSEAFAKRDL